MLWQGSSLRRVVLVAFALLVAMPSVAEAANSPNMKFIKNFPYEAQ